MAATRNKFLEIEQQNNMLYNKFELILMFLVAVTTNLALGVSPLRPLELAS